MLNRCFIIIKFFIGTIPAANLCIHVLLDLTLSNEIVARLIELVKQRLHQVFLGRLSLATINSNVILCLIVLSVYNLLFVFDVQLAQVTHYCLMNEREALVNVRVVHLGDHEFFCLL